MSWINQGRQEHGWFGDGKALIAERNATIREQGPSVTDGMEQRITAVIHGSVAAMPRAARRQAERLATGVTLEHLKEILKTLASPDASPGWERNDPVVTALRAAAREAVKPDANPRAGAEHLATAIQAVGLDRWPGFIRDVARHAETLTNEAERGKSGSVQAVRAEVAPPFIRSAVEALASAIFSYTLSQTTRRRVLRDHGIDNAAERSYPLHHVVAWKDKRAADAPAVLNASDSHSGVSPDGVSFVIAFPMRHAGARRRSALQHLDERARNPD